MAQTVMTVIPGWQEFPKWKYSGDQSRLVQSAEEEDLLEGWGDSPGYVASTDEPAQDAPKRRGRPPKVNPDA